ncbi:MAG: hypothetical protein IJ730_04600 [Alphaproteobacteria bacterium]|nr:hypothetical protein [Alphaproteobacteria bacterium]
MKKSSDRLILNIAEYFSEDIKFSKSEIFSNLASNLLKQLEKRTSISIFGNKKEEFIKQFKDYIEYTN